MKIIVPVQGGLGNQLFQVATGIGLAEKHNSELVLENRLNYKLDFRYRRSFELPCSDLTSLPNIQSFALWFFSRYFIRTTGLSQYKKLQFSKKLFFHIEDSTKFNNVDLVDNDATHILLGYWQSPKYFQMYEHAILENLINPLIAIAWSADKQLASIDLGRDDIAVGIRFYEETPMPLAHANSKIPQSYTSWIRAIQELKEMNPRANVNIFTTLPEHDLVKLIVRTFDARLVDVRGSIQRLVAFSLFKNFVFNNSSFYWWGCYIRHLLGADSPITVRCSNNFKNQDTYIDYWSRFN